MSSSSKSKQSADPGQSKHYGKKKAPVMLAGLISTLDGPRYASNQDIGYSRTRKRTQQVVTGDDFEVESSHSGVGRSVVSESPDTADHEANSANSAKSPLPEEDGNDVPTLDTLPAVHSDEELEEADDFVFIQSSASFFPATTERSNEQRDKIGVLQRAPARRKRRKQKSRAKKTRKPTQKTRRYEEKITHVADDIDLDGEYREEEMGDEEDEDDDEINCVCGNTMVDGLMIQCDQCKAWVHSDCVGYTSRMLKRLEATGEEYKCPTCDPVAAAAIQKRRRNQRRKHRASTSARAKVADLAPHDTWVASYKGSTSSHHGQRRTNPKKIGWKKVPFLLCVPQPLGYRREARTDCSYIKFQMHNPSVNQSSSAPWWQSTTVEEVQFNSNRVGPNLLSGVPSFSKDPKAPTFRSTVLKPNTSNFDNGITTPKGHNQGLNRVPSSEGDWFDRKDGSRTLGEHHRLVVRLKERERRTSMRRDLQGLRDILPEFKNLSGVSQARQSESRILQAARRSVAMLQADEKDLKERITRLRAENRRLRAKNPTLASEFVEIPTINFPSIKDRKWVAMPEIENYVPITDTFGQAFDSDLSDDEKTISDCHKRRLGIEARQPH